MAHSQVLPASIELVKLQLHQTRLNVSRDSRRINMSGLNARLFPALLSFPDALHRTLAGV
jgi:hypothetical protein